MNVITYADQTHPYQDHIGIYMNVNQIALERLFLHIMTFNIANLPNALLNVIQLHVLLDKISTIYAKNIVVTVLHIIQLLLH